MGTIKATKTVKIELSLITDFNEASNIAEKAIETGQKIAKDAKTQFELSERKYEEAIKILEKGISLSKELGSDTKWFEGQQAMMKNMLKIAASNTNRMASVFSA